MVSPDPLDPAERVHENRRANRNDTLFEADCSEASADVLPSDSSGSHKTPAQAAPFPNQEQHRSIAFIEESYANASLAHRLSLAEELNSSSSSPVSIESIRNHIDVTTHNVTPQPDVANKDFSAFDAGLGRLSLDKGSRDRRGFSSMLDGASDPTPSQPKDCISKKRPASSQAHRGDYDEPQNQVKRLPHPVSPRCGYAKASLPPSEPFASARSPDRHNKEPRRMPRQHYKTGIFGALPSSSVNVSRCGTRSTSPIVSGETADLEPPSAPSAHIDTEHKNPTDVIISSRFPEMILQPKSNPISQSQLVSEIEGIYNNLVKTEHKCNAVVSSQLSPQRRGTSLTPQQWQAVVALHRTLLNEYHDFLLAVQHPSAPDPIKALALQRDIPRRMWEKGVHNLLELLRHHITDALDFMLDFVYLAYQMVALLYETVPAFAQTWTECLGDISRYRTSMADVGPELNDAEIWAGVSRYWYSKASCIDPTIGRLQHHLGILARHTLLPQLFYDAKALTCASPFPNARNRMTAIFAQINEWAKNPDKFTQLSWSNSDANFAYIHSTIFRGGFLEQTINPTCEYCSCLDRQIQTQEAAWKVQGVYIAVINISAWFQYGLDTNPLKQLFADDPQRKPQDFTPAKCKSWLGNAMSITFGVLRAVLRRTQGTKVDLNVLPHVHVVLLFLYSLLHKSAPHAALTEIISSAPWDDITNFMNTVQRTVAGSDATRFSVTSELTETTSTGSDQPAHPQQRSLPEDYLIRGALWLPDDVAATTAMRAATTDVDTQLLELKSSDTVRMLRILSLGRRLSAEQYAMKEQSLVAYTVSRKHFPEPRYPKPLESAQLLTACKMVLDSPQTSHRGLTEQLPSARANPMAVSKLIEHRNSNR